jgi:hypothetical protein
MNSNNAALRQDLIANSVDHRMFTFANSVTSPAQLENLLASEFGHNLIARSRQYLETYLDSDATGRVPLDAEQLQDGLDADSDHDAALAREYVEELKGENVRVAYSNDNARVLPIKERSKTQEVGR